MVLDFPQAVDIHPAALLEWEGEYCGFGQENMCFIAVRISALQGFSARKRQKLPG